MLKVLIRIRISIVRLKEMIFINPMWDNESERIGKQMCTPLGSKLHAISDGIGFIGFLLLLCTFGYLAYRGITETFHPRLFWLLAIPFGLGLLGSALYRYSWALALRKSWAYDYDNREASWMENGQQRKYKWKAETSA